jgi:hypothetical protein
MITSYTQTILQSGVGDFARRYSLGTPRCGQATAPTITRDSDERKIVQLGRPGVVIVIDAIRYAHYAMAKGRDRGAASDSGEALEADRSRNRKRRIEFAKVRSTISLAKKRGESWTF